MATRQLDRGSPSQSTLSCLWRFSLSSLSSLSLRASQRETAKGAGALEILARIRRDGDEKDPSIQAQYQEIKDNATITELLSGSLPWESKIRLFPASSRALEHTKDVLHWRSRPECLHVSLGDHSALASPAYQTTRLQGGLARLTVPPKTPRKLLSTEWPPYPLFYLLLCSGHHSAIQRKQSPTIAAPKETHGALWTGPLGLALAHRLLHSCWTPFRAMGAMLVKSS